MIKKITIAILLVSMFLLLCGCDDSSNHPFATQTINTKAYIRVDEKTIVVDVEAFVHVADSAIAIYGKDGTYYKTHTANVVLIKEPEGR